MSVAEVPFPFRFFDRDDEMFITEQRRFPHWSQAGTLCFITWRTWDSLPRTVIAAWHQERGEWLLRHQIDPSRDDWRSQLALLPRQKQREFHDTFTSRWEDSLDDCHGACVLRQPELANLVQTSLLHFHGDRYFLTDCVVMPNHVHLLAAFTDPEGMSKQCASWKHFTARHINRKLNQRGHFWASESFDHLVRSEEQFEYYRDYLANNPVKANLRLGEYLHFSRDLPGSVARVVGKASFAEQLRM